MIHHIVMWKFKPEITEEQKPELKRKMSKHLCALTDKIPGLITAVFVETPLSSSTHDIALVTTFKSAEDIAVYATHPDHVYVADKYVRPYVTDRACLDY